MRPAFAGPPFHTDDPEPVDLGHFEINLFSLGTQTAGGWAGLLPALEINYGAAPQLQLHVIAQQGYVAPESGRTGFALADLELGAKYRFLDPGDDDWYPQAGVFPTIELPSGNPRLGFNTGHAQIYLPLWLQKDFGAWTIYGGGGYWINPGPGNLNYGFAGVALWRKISQRLNLGVELFHQTVSAKVIGLNVPTSSSLPNPGLRASTGFNLGETYDLSDHWHVLVSAGTGLQNRRATNAFSYYSAVQLTF